KTAEGTAKQMAAYVREALTSSLAAKLGALLAESGLRALRDRMDPRRFNGGPLLGRNGVVVKDDGGVGAVCSARPVGGGRDVAASDLVAHLAGDLDALHGKISEGKASEEKQA